MLESPMLKKMIATSKHEDPLAISKDRFGIVSQEVARLLREAIDEKMLRKLILLASKCPNLPTFREALLS
jgi:hypothetical protein